MKNRKNHQVVSVLVAALFSVQALSEVCAQNSRGVTPLPPRAESPAAAPATPAKFGAPLPVVVELFVTGDDAANKAAIALLKSLPTKMPKQNILTMSAHVYRDRQGNIEPSNFPLLQRQYVLQVNHKVKDTRAPLMIIDGAYPVAPVTEQNLLKAIAEVRKQNRQVISTDAYISGKNVKIIVNADYHKRQTDNCRIGAFIYASASGDDEPVVRQVADFGYLSPGHQGACTTVITLDPIWYKSDRYKQLNVVAVMHDTITGKIIGAASTVVQKSKEGWF